jgi:hypothetical protein
MPANHIHSIEQDRDDRYGRHARHLHIVASFTALNHG